MNDRSELRSDFDRGTTMPNHPLQRPNSQALLLVVLLLAGSATGYGGDPTNAHTIDTVLRIWKAQDSAIVTARFDVSLYR